MPNYLFEIETGDGIAMYPADAPYIQRDQCLYAADELVRVVIGDVADLLTEITHEIDVTPENYNRWHAAGIVADRFYRDACDLFSQDDQSWSTDPEALQYLLERAESLPGVSVDWDGDCGTVTITASDRWIYSDSDSDSNADEQIR